MIKAGVKISGKYQEGEALGLLEELNPHIAFLPALWPETYSYTLTLALKLGRPIVAFDIGAIATRLRAASWSKGLMPLAHADRIKDINLRIMSLAHKI